jgi:catechol 2,3-dioxygenase-like lactoylglutathione lyase family enzyme
MGTEPTYQITIDCSDPDTMARFWAPVLGYELQEPPAPHPSWKDYWVSVGVPEDEADGYGYDSIVDPVATRPRVWFQVVPEPKEVKNRLHFDLLVGGGRTVSLEERKQRVTAEADRVGALGATRLRVIDNSEYNHFAIAMADPEGNEFDIV